MNEYTRGDYSLQRFKPEDWRLLKAIRLEALKTTPAVYGSNYGLESGFEDEYWKNRLTDPNNAIWGLYFKGELIGATGFFRDEHNPARAKLTISFIQEKHRGKGLASLFYAARIDWARAVGCKQLIITHRKGNTASERAIRRNGFRHTHTEDRLWPDGTVEDHLFYVMDL